MTHSKLGVVTSLSLSVLFSLPAISYAATQTPTFARNPSRIVTVTPIPGSPEQSGDVLLQALAGITPSPGDRWLVKIEPGIYDIGTRNLEVKPWVDIEGSGVLQTEIVGTGQPTTLLDVDLGVVNGSDNSELRQLTVRCESAAGSEACITLANVNASPRLTDLRIMATDAIGKHWGIRNSNGSPILDRVEIIVQNGEENIAMVNANIGAAASRPEIIRSVFYAGGGSDLNDGILNRGSSSPLFLEDVTITAAGGTSSSGIRALSPLPGAPDLILTDVTIVARDAVNNYGVRDGLYRLVVENSRIDAMGANSFAIDMLSGPGVDVTHSELVGRVVLVQADEVRIGATWLRGGGEILGVSLEQCAGVHTSEFKFFAETCP